MTLLTSFIIVPRVAIELTVPDNLYITGATVQTAAPSPTSAKGFTTGSMGSNNLSKGTPAISKGTTSRLQTSEGVNLMGTQKALGLKTNLEPSITAMTGLNKVIPKTELVKLT